MEVQEDFKELLELLNSRGAEYLIVGGYALALHGAPRYTGDLDVYVKPDPENASKIMEVLDVLRRYHGLRIGATYGEAFYSEEALPFGPLDFFGPGETSSD